MTPSPSSSPSPSDDAPPAPVPVPWWKRPVVWLVAIGGALAGLAFFSRATKRLPSPPAPPDVPLVKIPTVNDKPSDTYEAGKVKTSEEVTDPEVKAAITRLNAQDSVKP